jgi:hypothetical protein
VGPTGDSLQDTACCRSVYDVRIIIMRRFINGFTSSAIVIFILGLGAEIVLPYIMTERVLALVIGTSIIIIGILLGIIGFTRKPKPTDAHKMEAANSIDESYAKVLELLPKMHSRLKEIPYEQACQKFDKSTLGDINSRMLAIKVGSTLLERTPYLLLLTSVMDGYQIKLIDSIESDATWHQLEKELEKYTMRIEDTGLKKSIILYKQFIIGLYYENVYYEYLGRLGHAHIGKANSKMADELILSEINTDIARRIYKLKAT